MAGVVNVNTATVAELELLPGVGPAKAQAILEARRERGGFKSVEELEDVKGIGPAALERLRPFARISGQTTALAE
jgi:competence protein ComEA